MGCYVCNQEEEVKLVLKLVRDLFDAEQNAQSCRATDRNGLPLPTFDGGRYWLIRRRLQDFAAKGHVDLED